MKKQHLLKISKIADDIYLFDSFSYGYIPTGLSYGYSNRRELSESGRSMVEMLGVLAITGVLSIGGITAYRYALEKYYANEVVDEVIKRAVVAATQLVNYNDIKVSEFPKTVSGITYEVGLADEEDNASFFVDVSGLNLDTCKIILKNLPVHVSEIIIDGTAYEPSSVPESINSCDLISFGFYDDFESNELKNPASTIACNKHGYLSGDECVCDTGWSGEKCRVSICSGHGYLSAGNCVCYEGWSGSDCSVKSIGSELCSFNGWDDVTICYCIHGFGGYDCSQDARAVCNYHGVWSWHCECDPGYAGEYCDKTIREICNNHGIWTDYCGGTCDCDSGWTGLWCSEQM